MFFTTKKNIRKHLILLLMDEMFTTIKHIEKDIISCYDDDVRKKKLSKSLKTNKMILTYLDDVLGKIDRNFY